MRKTICCCTLTLISLCASVHADLLFKINTEFGQTDLLPGEQITVTVSAKAEGVAPDNGLFGWGFDAFVDTSGVVEIVDGTLLFLNPDPWSPDPDTKWSSYNGGITGGTGSIEYMRLQAALEFVGNSPVGADVYTPIAQFDIKAIGTVSESVAYTLGGTNFGGILADITTEYSVDLGNVHFVADESQNVFNIVPEPASLLILSGLGMIGFLCRKK